MMSLILFLDRHLWLYRLLCGVLLAMTGWLAVRPLLRSDRPALRGWGRPLFFLLALVATLFALRYPIFFYPTYLEMDEAQMLSQAITFHVHPIPWHDVDTGTGGPLDSQALLWCVPFGVAPTYVTTRIFGLLCVAGMFVFLHLTGRRLAGEGLSRLALLPTFLFFGFTSMFDWVHYSSEHLSLLLLAASLYLLTGLWRRPDSRISAFALGVLLGLLPFAKLQSVLPGAFLGLTGIAILATRKRREPWLRSGPPRLLALIAGALLPAVVLLSIVAHAGALGDFWKSYIAMGGSYVQGTLAESHDPRWFGLLARARLVVSLIFDPRLESAFPVYLTAVLAGWAVVRLLPSLRHSKALVRNLVWVGLFTGVLAATVVFPVRKYSHYVLYMMVALPLLLAVVLRMIRRKLAAWRPAELRRELGWLWLLTAGVTAVLLATWKHWPPPYAGTNPLFVATPGPVPSIVFPLIGLLVLLLLDQRLLAGDGKKRIGIAGPPAAFRAMALLTYLIPFFLISALALASYPNPYSGKIRSFVEQPPSAIDQAILRLRPPGGEVVVWGNQPDYLAETGSVCGSRTCAAGYVILDSPMQPYYRRLFLEDMRANRPALFIEAVSPHNFFCHDPLHEGITIFPELSALIASDYRLARTIDGVRFFVRADLPPPAVAPDEAADAEKR